MSQLRELQQSFGNYLFSPDDDASVVESIISDDAGTATERLSLYADSYVLRLIESLGVDFPGVHTLLGDSSFADMCRMYIEKYPSRHPNIRWFGRDMVEFLSATTPYSNHEVLLEMANFEWAKNYVFDAPDCDFVTLDDLSAIGPAKWGGMTFEFVPALRRLLFHNNVGLLWDAIHQDIDELPDLQRSDDPVAWIVWRKGLDPHWRSLDVDESFALEYCRQGMNFGDLCEQLCEWVDEQHAPMRAVTFLKSWVDGQMVNTINLVD